METFTNLKKNESICKPTPPLPLKKVINRLEPAGTKQAALQQTIDERMKSLDQSVKIEGERKKNPVKDLPLKVKMCNLANSKET